MALALALLAFVMAHLTIVAGIARRRPWWHAAAALIIAPLAPWWGWDAGMHRRTMAWGAALAVYTLGVAIA